MKKILFIILITNFAFSQVDYTISNSTPTKNIEIDGTAKITTTPTITTATKVLVKNPSTNEISEQVVSGGVTSGITTQGFITLTNDTTIITAWASPFTTVVVPEFNTISVPAGKTINVEIYGLISSSSNGWGFSFENKNFIAGDDACGEMLLSNYTAPSAANGGNWFHFNFNRTNYDSAPTTTRKIDNAYGGSATNPALMVLRYSWTNNSATAKLFSAGWGADVNIAQAVLNLAFKRGSYMKYLIN